MIPPNVELTKQQINDLVYSLEAPMHNINKRIARACVAPMFTGLGLTGLALLYVRNAKVVSFCDSVSAICSSIKTFGTAFFALKAN